MHPVVRPSPVARFRASVGAPVAGTMFVVALLLIALIAYSTAQEATSLRSLAQQQSRDDSELVALAVDGFLLSTLRMLETLSLHPAIANRDPAGATDALGRLLEAHPEYANLWATGLDGRNWASALPPPGGTHLHIGDRQYFQQALASGRIAVQSIPDNRQHPTRFAVVLCIPVNGPAGRPMGTLQAAFELLPLERSLAGIPLAPEAVVSLLDENGYVIARSREPESWVGSSVVGMAFWTVMGERTTGIYEGRTIDGASRLAGFSTTRLAPWKAIVAVPTEAAYADLPGAIVRELVLLLAPSLAVVVLAVRLGRVALERAEARRAAERLARLQGATEALAGALTPDQVAAVLLDYGCRVLRAEAGVVGVVETGGDSLRALRHPGPAGEGAERWQVLPLAAPTPVAEAARRGRALFLESPAEMDERFGPTTRAAIRGQAVAALPMMLDGRVIGGLEFAFPRAGRLDSDEGALLSALAQQGALALERARLYEEEHRARAEADAIVVAMADGMVVYNQEGEILRMNRAAEEILGYPMARYGRLKRFDERRALTRLERVDGQPFGIDQTPARRALQGETVHSVVMGVIRRGQTVWVAASAAPVLNQAGEVSGAVATFTDITPLRETEEIREEFLQGISHDLRTPLTVIQGHAQLVLRHQACQATDSHLGKSAEAIVAASRRMNLIIADLIDASRFETRGFVLDRQPGEMAFVLRRVLESSRETLEVGRVVVTVAPDLPTVWVDPARLERVFTALLYDALKYSSDESPVAIDVRGVGGEAVVSVSDQGDRLTPEELPRLFQRFYRPAHSRRAEGLGLGLYMARIMVEAHGGRIRAELRPGGGSTFVFTLPVSG